MFKNYLFTKRNLVVIPDNCGQSNNALAMTALKNLESIGFILDKQGVENLAYADEEHIKDWYFETEKMLKDSLGANKNHVLFYPDFPNDIMATSQIDHFFDQLLYYLCEDIKPEGENRKKGIQSLEGHPLKVLHTIYEKDVDSILSKIFLHLLSSKQNPNKDDLAFILSFCDTHSDWVSNISHVENRNLLSMLYAKAMVEDKVLKASLVTNDYLRIAKVLAHVKANGEFALPNDKMKIASISNKYRRHLLAGLNKEKNLEEDVARDKQAWKSFFRMVHVGTFPQFTRVQSVAYKLRNNKKLNTFYGRVEQAFAEKRGLDLVSLYRSRPGEFMANIGRLLTFVPKEETGLYANALSKACIDVFESARMEDIIKVLQYLNSRTRSDRYETRELYGKEGKQAPLSKDLYEAIAVLAKKTIKKRLKTLDYSGKIYIDPELSHYCLPKKKEDDSSSFASLTPGSRIPVERNEDGTLKNLRLMLYFSHNGKPRWGNIVDISVAFFSKNEEAKNSKDYLTCKGTLAWFGGRTRFGCWHSGDWIGTEDEAFECIDLNTSKLIENGITHVMFHTNVWSGGTFDEEQVNFGWQEREELDKSDQFDIKAVKQHSLLTGKAMGNIPGILDLEKGEILWLDYPDKQAKNCSDVRGAIKYASYLYDRYGKGDLITQKEFAEWIAEDASIVDNPEDADVLFLVSPYEDKKEEQTVITATNQDIWQSFLTL